MSGKKYSTWDIFNILYRDQWFYSSVEITDIINRNLLYQTLLLFSKLYLSNYIPFSPIVLSTKTWKFTLFHNLLPPPSTFLNILYLDTSYLISTMAIGANLLLEVCLQQHRNSRYKGFYKEKNEKYKEIYTS